MMRAAFMLGTAALASGQDVAVQDLAVIPFVKNTFSAVNFTVVSDYSTSDFAKFSTGLTLGILTHLNGVPANYGIEWTDLRPSLETGLSQSVVTARFYSTDVGANAEGVVDEARVKEIKEAVENIALAFYQEANEAQWEKYEDEQYKAWEIKNAADKKFELYDRKLYTNPPTPIPEVVEPTAAEIEAQKKLDEEKAKDFYERLDARIHYVEIDCKRTNYNQADLPEWAKLAEFKEPSFSAQCHDDDSLSWVAVFGLFCGWWVVLGMFVFLFILVCSGSNQGKPAPEEEPTF